MQKRWLIVALAAAVLIAFFLWIRTSAQFPFPNKSGTIETRDLQKWEPVFCLKFPKSTEVLAGRWQRALDTYVHVRLRMHRVELPAFIATSPFENDPPRPAGQYAIATEQPGDPGWSAIKSAKNCRNWEANPRPGEALIVHIVEDDPTEAVVYIIWFDS